MCLLSDDAHIHSPGVPIGYRTVSSSAGHQLCLGKWATPEKWGMDRQESVTEWWQWRTFVEKKQQFTQTHSNDKKKDKSREAWVVRYGSTCVWSGGKQKFKSLWPACERCLNDFLRTSCLILLALNHYQSILNKRNICSIVHFRTTLNAVWNIIMGYKTRRLDD